MKTSEELDNIEAGLRDTYKKVFKLKVATNEEETEFCTIFLRSLDEKTYKAVNVVIERDELSAAKLLINDLYIGGDDKNIIVNDFDCLLAASKYLGNMFKVRKTSIETLVKKK